MAQPSPEQKIDVDKVEELIMDLTRQMHQLVHDQGLSPDGEAVKAMLALIEKLSRHIRA